MPQLDLMRIEIRTDAIFARFGAATKAIDDCDRAYRMGPGRRPSLLVYRVVCVDEDTTLWSMSDIGNLRVALNALARVFGC